MSSSLEQLIHVFGKLPGLGPRSARRVVLHLLKHQQTLMQPLTDALIQAQKNLHHCPLCGNIDEITPCHICQDSSRDRSLMCIVEDIADMWALERSRIYRGHYHILGGTLSALDGRGPETLRMELLLERIRKDDVKEVILATSATIEGQTTAHYITERLQTLPLTISRLALGIPMGAELDYLDDGTLSAALKSRHAWSEHA